MMLTIKAAMAMNTLRIESLLAEKYKYKTLPNELSQKYRQFFKENIPTGLFESGGSETLYTTKCSPICDGYDRIVIGDYGAFIEFGCLPYLNYIIKPGQEYRVFDERYSKNCKYIWLTINDGSDIKIYKQKKTVSYADYLPGKLYVSVHEVVVR